MGNFYRESDVLPGGLSPKSVVYNRNRINIVAKSLLLLVAMVCACSGVWGQTTLLTEGYESTTIYDDIYKANDWYAYNAGSGNNWTLNTSSSYANSGSNSAQVEYNSSYAANCYLVSSPFTVSANMTELSVSLYERVRSSTYAEIFEVFFVKASDVTTLASVASATHYNAISSTSYTNESYAQKSGSVTNAALAGQSVRVVVHCTSAANMWYLYIDDITVTETTSGGGTPHTYNIIYEANGGTGTMSPQTGSGSSVTLTANAFTYTGKVFAGWNTLSNGSGISYTDGQTIALSADFTTKLFAQWADAGSSSCPQIGSETNTTYVYVPVDNYYNYTYTQMLFTSDELSAGSITSIGFQYAYSTPMSSKTDVKIYMQETTKTSFSSTTDWVTDLTEADLVYSGDLNCSNGWNDFLLTTPFYYSGNNSLIVVIDDNSNGYDDTYARDYVFKYSSASGYKYMSYHNDNTNKNNSDISGTTASTLGEYRPNIKFCIESCMSRPAMSFSQSVINHTIGSAFTKPTLTNGTGAEFTSSNTAVATVNSSTGDITIVGPGSTIIKATIEASDGYCTSMTTYTINVSANCTSTITMSNG